MLSALLHAGQPPGKGGLILMLYTRAQDSPEPDRVNGTGRQRPGPEEPESRRLACPRWARGDSRDLLLDLWA